VSAEPTPRPGILDIEAYVGGESRAPRARLARLASNEGALGASPKAMAAYKAAADELHRYPDGAAAALREAIGRRWGIDAARIVCGSGSDELISLLARCYAGPGEEVLYSRHGFLMYPIAARAAGATPVAVPERDLKADVDAILDRVGERTRIVFLANPNNPTGSFLTAEEVERLHAGLPGRVLLVVDAAYAEFVARNDYADGLDLAARSANVVVTRTFSKIFGLAALRLGWAFAPPAVADVLNRVRGPFNVNAAALAAGLAALEDVAFTDAARAHNDTWRAWTEEKLKGLGLTVHPSIGNFLLVGFAGPRAAEAARLALKDEGVLVRQMGAYGLPDHLRVTIGSAEDMAHFIDALGRWRAA
jgi:histidinol-phosphate aminotransferase